LIELIALAMVIFGLYLIFSGIKEREEWERVEEKERGQMAKKADVKGGGVILIGPIPIVFGESKYAFYSLILAILLMTLLLAFILLLSDMHV